MRFVSRDYCGCRSLSQRNHLLIAKRVRDPLIRALLPMAWLWRDIKAARSKARSTASPQLGTVINISFTTNVKRFMATYVVISKIKALLWHPVAERAEEEKADGGRTVVWGAAARYTEYPARGNISPGNQETWESCGTCRATLPFFPANAAPSLSLDRAVANPASTPRGLPAAVVRSTLSTAASSCGCFDKAEVPQSVWHVAASHSRSQKLCGV